MKKLLAVLLTVLFAVATPVSAAEEFSDGTESEIHWQYHVDIPGLETMNGYYPLTGIVTEVESIDSETDLITITCANGNMFSWYSDVSDCWELNDIASCIMYTNDTKRVYDDEVVLAHYAGGLKHLAQYARED